MDEENEKPTSMAQKKNRTNDRKSFCILYLSLMASASIAVAVQAMDEKKDSLTVVVHDMLLGALYATSACVMFGATIYFAVKRGETFEAAQRISGPVSFIVKYSRCGEPVNLYLRLGLALFAAMSIGQSSIRIHEMQMGPPMQWPEVFKSTFELSFFVAQTLFILIYHRIVILHNNEIFGSCFIHVLSTNLCMWADVMVDKVSTTLHLDSKPNASADAAHGKYGGGESSSSVSFYLLPAVSEYCLLSAALIYEITVRIGQPSYIELEGDSDDGDDEDDEEEADDYEADSGFERRSSIETGTRRRESSATATGKASSNSETSITATMTRSEGSVTDPEEGMRVKRRRPKGRSLSRLMAKHIRKAKTQLKQCGANIKSGYWAPLLIVLAISALTITTGKGPKTGKITPWKCAVLFSEEMFLNCMGIFVTLASFFKMRHLKFTIASRQSTIDEFVLYIAFFFSANYLVATVALASHFNRITSEGTHKDLLMGRLALNMLELVEVILQTYLIQDCFRRCSEEDFQQRIKPGRQMIAVLLGINLAGWVVKSFQLKEADVLYNITPHDTIAYGWVLIAITMPVFLFYRYHCTVCLSQAFTMLYEDETRRFEALWRQNPIYLTQLLSHTNLAMCAEGGDHFHARENLTSARMSSRQLSAMLHRKFSTQSFQQIEYMMPRRASFFHPSAAALPLSMSTSSIHDDEMMHHLYQHQQNPLVQHKLSAVPFAQKKLSMPNLKRLSVPGPKPQQMRVNASAVGAFPTRNRLAESESYEGPNYFLSRISSANNGSMRDEHATQTIDRFGSTNRRTSNDILAPTKETNELLSPPEGDGMQRRQTLVNLETAKYRYLAAEMAHKKVLERSADAATGKSKKHQKPKQKYKKREKSSTGTSKKTDLANKTLTAGVEKRVSSPSAVPKSQHQNTPPPPLLIVEPAGAAQPVEQQQQPMVQGFEPSKMVPLLIASRSATDGVPLSAVPEEAAQDGFMSTPPLVLSSTVSTSVSPTPGEGEESGETFQSEEAMRTPVGGEPEEQSMSEEKSSEQRGVEEQEQDAGK